MINILQNKNLRRVVLTVAGLLIVAGVAVGTMFLLTRVITPPKPAEKAISQAVIKQQIELGRQNVVSGTEKASKGETDAAISLYKEAIAHFEKADDKASVDAVQLEIEYLEKLKTMSKTAPSDASTSDTTVPATPTLVDPTKDAGYGVTATYPR